MWQSELTLGAPAQDDDRFKFEVLVRKWDSKKSDKYRKLRLKRLKERFDAAQLEKRWKDYDHLVAVRLWFPVLFGHRR
jgi:hypothetical protein